MNSKRIEPGEALYERLHAYWLKNNKASTFGALGRMFMAHSDLDGTIVFIEIGASGQDLHEYGSRSL